jgi:thiol:disulfide interchange protein
MIAAKILDTAQLLHVVEASLIAGVGISLVFSLVIRGTARADERRRQSRHVAAGAHAALALIAFAVCVAAIAYGVSIMLSK